MSSSTSTIVAIASAAGIGGVGIVRLSGPQSVQIAAHLGIARMQPRHAHYARFRDGHGAVIDDGIALWFNAAAQLHPAKMSSSCKVMAARVLLRQLVARCIELGARQARAGEFSERAFL
ncbi:tRNA uridine-5-carboxymethylaminomethyl(34) synthesis GTPase MnmE, partial [Pseudomonas avellanae]